MRAESYTRLGTGAPASKKYRFLKFKKHLMDRISLNSFILSIRSVVLIVQIFKKFTEGN